MQCPTFDVSTAADWRRCGRFHAYTAIAIVMVIVIIVVWANAGTDSAIIASIIGVAVVGYMAMYLPDAMGDVHARDHELRSRLADKYAKTMSREDAIHMVKLEDTGKTLEKITYGVGGFGLAIVASAFGNLLAGSLWG